jgi:hypothetical protein
MGGRSGTGKAALAVALLLTAARSRAETVVEPVARLSLEGGYDSNALYEGQGDRTGRISPELGLRLRDPLWDLDARYGGDFITYERLHPQGVWNHRGILALKATPTRRLSIDAGLRGGYAFDPIGLAQMGIFRTGQSAATIVQGRGRVEWLASHRLVLATSLVERTVIFADRTGGAMHAPSLEALWRQTERLSLGAAFGVGVFQGFELTGSSIGYSSSLKARLRYRITRMLDVDGSAGPAYWSGSGGRAIVPEAAAQLLLHTRAWDVRGSLSHGLGIGSTARPGLVNAAELGFARRLGLKWLVSGDAGLWQSGRAPSGGDAVLGYAATAEAGMLVGAGVRLSLAATHFAQLNDPTGALSRTTLGLRLGWELAAR